LINATHNHTNAAGGGVLGPDALGILKITQTADYTGTSNSSSAQKVFNGSANGATTVAAGTLYEVDAVIHIGTTDTDSAQLRFGFGGSATYTWTGITNDNVLAAVSSSSGTHYWGWYSTPNGVDFGAGQQVITTAVATQKHVTLRLQGHIQVNAGGTLIPQYSYSAANQASPITRRGSYFKLTPTASIIGAWT